MGEKDMEYLFGMLPSLPKRALRIVGSQMYCQAFIFRETWQIRK